MQRHALELLLAVEAAPHLDGALVEAAVHQLQAAAVQVALRLPGGEALGQVHPHGVEQVPGDLLAHGDLLLDECAVEHARADLILELIDIGEAVGGGEAVRLGGDDAVDALGREGDGEVLAADLLDLVVLGSLGADGDGLAGLGEAELGLEILDHDAEDHAAAAAVGAVGVLSPAPSGAGPGHPEVGAGVPPPMERIASARVRHTRISTVRNTNARRIGRSPQGSVEGDHVSVGRETARVLFIPAHTRGHIAYAFDGAVFCGDTLFSIGCGRTFEGTAQQMWNSLCKLRALPDDTWIYCGHEYTESNCRFALTVEPENRDLVEFAEAAKQARAQGDKTIPSNLGTEKFCNPFLRADQPRLLARFGGPKQDPATAFGAIRAAKDKF